MLPQLLLLLLLLPPPLLPSAPSLLQLLLPLLTLSPCAQCQRLGKLCPQFFSMWASASPCTGGCPA